jgi:hypothetical protein
MTDVGSTKQGVIESAKEALGAAFAISCLAIRFRGQKRVGL